MSLQSYTLWIASIRLLKIDITMILKQLILFLVVIVFVDSQYPKQTQKTKHKKIAQDKWYISNWKKYHIPKEVSTQDLANILDKLSSFKRKEYCPFPTEKCGKVSADAVLIKLIEMMTNKTNQNSTTTPKPNTTIKPKNKTPKKPKQNTPTIANTSTNLKQNTTTTTQPKDKKPVPIENRNPLKFKKMPTLRNEKGTARLHLHYKEKYDESDEKPGAVRIALDYYGY